MVTETHLEVNACAGCLRHDVRWTPAARDHGSRTLTAPMAR